MNKISIINLMRRTVHRWATLLPVVLGGVCFSACALTTDGPDVHDPALVGAIAVERFVSSGTNRLVPYDETRYDTVSVSAVVSTVTHRNGSVLLRLALQKGVYYSLIHDNTVQRLDDETTSLSPSTRFIPVLAEPNPVFLECHSDGSSFVTWGESDELVTGNSSADLCNVGSNQVFGYSSKKNHVVAIHIDGSNLIATSWDLTGQETSQSQAFALAEDDAAPFWVEETEDSRFLAVSYSASTNKFYVSELGKTDRVVNAPVDGSVLQAFFDENNQRVFLTNLGDLFRWDIRNEQSKPTLITTPEAPKGLKWQLGGNQAAGFVEVFVQSAAEPNVLVPASAVIRRGFANQFSIFDSATTPCDYRSQCRDYGESTMIGVIDQPQPMALYLFWSWTGYVTVFLSPAQRAEVP